MFAVTFSSPWLLFNRVPTSGNYYSYFTILFYADLAWNNDSSVTVDEKKYFEATAKDKADFADAAKKGESLRLQKIFRYGNALVWKYNKERFPDESDKFAPVDLTRWQNEDVTNLLAKANINDSKDWKTGINKIADIPTDLANRCILLDAKNNIIKNITLNRKAGSLIFLHTVLAPESPDALWQKSGAMRNSAEFCLMGNYVVRYADGTEATIPIQYGYTIYNLRPPIHLRFPYKVRYVYKPFADRNWPEAISGRELTPGAPALYQYEWPNPYPEKVIASLDFVSLEPVACPALFAITVRESGNEPK